jgi:hypothetical protein
MMPMAVLSGTAFHKIRRFLVIKASRPLRRVPGRSIVTEDIKGLAATPDLKKPGEVHFAQLLHSLV